MEPLRMTHLEYAKRRDVVFFFGAGASVADGIPLQACILPKALSQSRVRDSQVGREVVRFLERVFGLDSTPYQMPSLETLFAFLDYFISRNEHLDSEHSGNRLREIQECLVKIIHYAIGQRGTRDAAAHRVFWEAVGSSNRNVSMVSLNYDSVLDEAFVRAPDAEPRAASRRLRRRSAARYPRRRPLVAMVALSSWVDSLTIRAGWDLHPPAPVEQWQWGGEDGRRFRGSRGP